MQNIEQTEVQEKEWFAEVDIHVSIGRHKKTVKCRAIRFAVTQTDIAFQVEVYEIEIVGLHKDDYAKIPTTSQQLIKARLIQAIGTKLTEGID